jgi:hypothetical protein
MPQPRILYERSLPGGGLVQVQVVLANGQSRRLGRISVERRSDLARRDGHNPPVIVELQAESVGRVVGPLISIARDNVRIAKGLLDVDGSSTARF